MKRATPDGSCDDDDGISPCAPRNLSISFMSCELSKGVRNCASEQRSRGVQHRSPFRKLCENSLSNPDGLVTSAAANTGIYLTSPTHKASRDCFEVDWGDGFDLDNLENAGERAVRAHQASVTAAAIVSPRPTVPISDVHLIAAQQQGEPVLVGLQVCTGNATQAPSSPKGSGSVRDLPPMPPAGSNPADVGTYAIPLYDETSPAAKPYGGVTTAASTTSHLQAQALAQSQQHMPKEPVAPVPAPAVKATTAAAPERTDRLPEYLAKLNDEQLTAATADHDVPVVVLAGPGSGKTSTMVSRVMHLLHGPARATPGQILAVTFTTAAAKELEERVAAALKSLPPPPPGPSSQPPPDHGRSEAGRPQGAGEAEKGAGNVVLTTFHGFCMTLCRAHASKLGRTDNFHLFQERRVGKVAAAAAAVVAEEEGHNRGTDSAASDAGAAAGWAAERQWGQKIGTWKAAGLTPAALRARGRDQDAAVLAHYEDTLQAADALDFNDLISGALRLLTQDNEVAAEVHAAHSYLLVDEFQDTSAQQYALLKALCPPPGRVTAVGDADQSIYGFNGSCAGNLAQLIADFPAARRVRLRLNYRSTANIVNAAASLLSAGAKKSGGGGGGAGAGAGAGGTAMSNSTRGGGSAVPLAPNGPVEAARGIGEPVDVVECRNTSAEAALVLDRILAAGMPRDGGGGASAAAGANAAQAGAGGGGCNGAGGAWRRGGRASFSEMAVLYRRQATGRELQTLFRERGVPFNTHGVAFYRRKQVRDVVGVLSAVVDPSDSAAGRRALKALWSPPGCSGSSEAARADAKKAADYIEKRRIASKHNSNSSNNSSSPIKSSESFLDIAQTTFGCKMHGTFSKQMIAAGRVAMGKLRNLRVLVAKEPSLSACVKFAVSLMPAKAAFDKPPMTAEAGARCGGNGGGGGRPTNDDPELRTLIQVLLDDVTEYLQSDADEDEPEGKESVRVREAGQGRTDAAPGGGGGGGCSDLVAVGVEGNPSAMPRDSHTGMEHPGAATKGGGALAQLRGFVEHLRVREAAGNRARRRDNKNSVAVMTLHQSKGLEWDHVYILGLNDGEIPLINCAPGGAGPAAPGGVSDATSTEEERRLLYVGMTRARKRLTLCYSRQDTCGMPLRRSRFLRDIDHRYLSDSVAAGGHGGPRDGGGAPRAGGAGVGAAAAGAGGGCPKMPHQQWPQQAHHPEGSGQEGDDGESALQAHVTASEEGHQPPAPDMTVMDDPFALLRRFHPDVRGNLTRIFNDVARKGIAFHDPARVVHRVKGRAHELLNSKKSGGGGCRSAPAAGGGGGSGASPPRPGQALTDGTACAVRATVPPAGDPARQALRELCELLKTKEGESEALALARKSIAQAQMPPEERELWKAQQQERYIQHAAHNKMSSAAPSAKQLSYLRSLGCREVPRTMADASRLIEKHK